MTIAFVQQSGATQESGAVTSTQKTLTGVLANSLIALVITNRDSGDFVTGVSDTVNGAWPAGLGNTGGGVAPGSSIWYFLASGSGNPTATITFNRALQNPAVLNFLEFSSAGTASLNDSDITQANSATTSHPCGSVDISAAGLILTTSALSGGDSTGYSAAANYTKLSDGGGFRIISQYRIATGTLTGESATWTSGVDSINTSAVMASFVESATTVKRMLLLGVG